MTDQPKQSIQPADDSLPPEAARYAMGLRVGVCGALVMLPVAFCIYVFGLARPHVSLGDLPRYWGLRAGEYIEQTGMPTGWQWTARLYESDVLSVLPAVFLAALSGLCLLSVLPIFARKRDYVYVLIILLQIALFIVAAMPGIGGTH